MVLLDWDEKHFCNTEKPVHLNQFVYIICDSNFVVYTSVELIIILLAYDQAIVQYSEDKLSTRSVLVAYPMSNI